MTVREFWGRTRREGECIVWTGWRRPRTGYGEATIGGRPWRVHRWIWEQINGPLGDAILLHTCDNPPCVNLAHLLPGTHQDNRADCVSKQRQARGMRSGTRKLTIDQVAECRRLVASGATHAAVAARMGVTRRAISYVISGRTWKEEQTDDRS